MEQIKIHWTWDEHKAEQMKSLLEDYDIPCYITSPKLAEEALKH